jgi:predicted RecB family nuclease
MAAKITSDVLESYLHCKFKSHLKLAGQHGTKCDFQTMLTELRAEVRLQAIETIIACHPGNQVARNIPLTTAGLERGPQYILDGTLEDDSLALHFDGLKRTEGESRLGGFHYLPVLFHESRQIKKGQKLLLEVYGMILSSLQGRAPAYGVIWHGRECKATMVKLNPDHRKAEQVLRDLREMAGTASPPRSLLNEHCHLCEFRQRCRKQAEEVDDISLLGGVGEKELKRYNRKGIFTLTQLSCTFRLKRKQGAAKKHDRSLQALAIRENTIYVAQRPELPDTKVRLYLDVEGMPDNGFYYLIGLTVVEGESRRRLNFWADGETDEASIWAAFLAAMLPLGDFVLLHYGGYESKFLKEMAGRHGGDAGLLARIKSSSINVLSLIYSRVYFPVCSNDLKSVVGCLGFRWSAQEASGLQAIAWRHSWEVSRDDRLKQLLLTYNEEDCDALERVTEMLGALGSNQGQQGDGNGPSVAGVETIPGQSGRKFCTQTFALPEFAQINKCSYFNYQRDKILCRTTPTVQKIGRRRKRPKPRAVRVNREIECGDPPAVCPQCGRADFGVMSRYQKLVIDLKPFRGGIKSWVTRYKVKRYRCRKCRKGMYPDDYSALPYRYGWGLCCWDVYATIALRQTHDAIGETLDDLFGHSLSHGSLVNLRQQAVDHYRPTYESLLSTLRNGPLIHADETKAKIRGPDKDGYVWVFANATTVVYVYSSTRDGDTVRKTLAGFKGVLVSDFYAAYDSMDCPQQKCLIHLIRDFNDDMLKNPFDEELKKQAARFAAVLQAVVATVDRFGLKKFYLHKHKKDVENFFEAEGEAVYQSEVARHYQQRLLKSRRKLFTFLDYDGVPWCNNNGEHAVKAFASRRKAIGKVFKEGGLQDYLLLLSIYQTLRYRNVSFWQFLQTGQTDIEAFTAKRR